METFLGIMIPFLGTTLGASCVFFMKKSLGDLVQRSLAGFAAGVMVAASIWSLLIPAIEQSINGRPTGFVDAQQRAWWWTSSTTEGTGAWWYGNSWAMNYMPYFIRMDADARTYFGFWIARSSYGYITNNIFHSDQSYGYLMYANSSDANVVINVIKEQFYMSVRCVKD